MIASVGTLAGSERRLRRTLSGLASGPQSLADLGCERHPDALSARLPSGQAFG